MQKFIANEVSIEEFHYLGCKKSIFPSSEVTQKVFIFLYSFHKCCDVFVISSNLYKYQNRDFKVKVTVGPHYKTMLSLYTGKMIISELGNWLNTV